MRTKFLFCYGMALFSTHVIAEAPPNPIGGNYGCEVKLCIASVNGPFEHNECRPPMTRLCRDLAKGRGWPSCPEADDDDTVKVKQGTETWEDCPAGYQDNGYRKDDRRLIAKICVVPSSWACTGHRDNQVCEFKTQTDVGKRTCPNWIETYVEGKLTSKFWWGSAPVCLGGSS